MNTCQRKLVYSLTPPNKLKLVKENLLVCNQLKHEQMKIAAMTLVKEKLLVCNRLKDLFTWKEGAPADRVTRLTELPWPGRANFSYVSLENELRCLHARQGNPPSRGTLSAYPGHPSGRDSFWHVNGSCRGTRLAEVRRPLHSALYSKAAFNVNCL